HVAQMTSPVAMRRCYDMVTKESAAIMGLEHYGLEVGKRADLVVLDAGDPVEAIRLRATRLLVMARGKVIARRARSPMQLSIDGREGAVDRRFRTPAPV
ncbi:MAG: amidohydrolase family protein, partial [Hoeflea sp.]|nr:amidohydrolase family protein [Hoeflea sp.]